MTISRFILPLAKADYLLNYTTQAGTGGDKRRFWWEIMGFRSPEALQAAILGAVSSAELHLQNEDQYGSRYSAVMPLVGPSGATRLVRTVWIVHPGENVARFVTAYPQRGSS